jgi:hypothetical protein
MIIKCDYCKEDYRAEPYFYDTAITTVHSITSTEKCYVALVRARSVCPYCGGTVEKLYEQDLSKRDIIDMATQREVD